MPMKVTVTTRRMPKLLWSFRGATGMFSRYPRVPRDQLWRTLV